MVAKKDMPATIQRSGKKAQETWSAVHDNAVEQYGEGERAHRTALAALKHTHEKVGDHWELKEGGRKGGSDRQGPPKRARNGRVPARTTDEGVDSNATKEHLLGIARELDVKGRSRMTKDELIEAIKKANRSATSAAGRS